MLISRMMHMKRRKYSEENFCCDPRVQYWPRHRGATHGTTGSTSVRLGLDTIVDRILPYLYSRSGCGQKFESELPF